MKKNQSQIAIGIALLLLMLLGCDKSVAPLKPKPDGAALQALTSTNIQTQTQRFALNAATGGSIKGSKGSILQFPANGFLTTAGVAVSGNVDVEFIEIYSRSSMLLAQKPSVGKRSNGNKEMLVSGGEFYVNATKDGNPLKPNGGYTIVAPTANTGGSTTGMNLFNGVEDCVDNVCNQVWQEQDATRGIEVGQFQNVGGAYSAYYAFQNKFGWTNIDRWYSDPRPKSTIFVEVPEGYNNSNCAVFIAYTGVPPALGRFDKFDDKTRRFTEHYGLIPIGLDVHIILVSIVEDKIYYAIKSVTVTENQVVVINEVKTITEEELIKLINGLS